MTVDHVTVPTTATATAADAVSAVRTAHAQPQALTSVYLVDERGGLLGAATLVAALQAAPTTPLSEIADHQPTRVGPGADIVEITRLMADYNLLQLPVVVDTDNHLLGVITVDDALDAAIPDNWHHREHDTAATTHDVSTSAPSPKE